ncbi:farnesyl diphosphate synthase [Amylostereum chailletii]|nr:farnesyl diphosphate synthase [Amylostereum chailletii]
MASLAPPTSEPRPVDPRLFEDAFSISRDRFLGQLKENGVPDDTVDYCRELFDYNVPGGKLNRGMAVIETATLLRGHELSLKEFSQAATLGWAAEFLQTCMLVVDDMMDGSTMRRGKACWYRVKNIGNRAINDMALVKSAIFRLLRSHFKHEPYYTALVEVFGDVAYKTTMGQCVDLITAPENRLNLSKFSFERHRLIVIYKTAIYSFYLPVATAMVMCGFPMSHAVSSPSSPDVYKLAWDILTPLGVYFQSQDDYLDYAGTSDQIGKVGTDIVDNKCSWCIVSALAVVSPAQRAVLESAYGRKNETDEELVREVFRTVGVDFLYQEYEKAAFDRVDGLIDRLVEVENPDGDAILRKEVFRRFLRKIHRRVK